MAEDFNSFAAPKVKTERFKIYANVGTVDAPEWELQGRGVGSWTISQNEEVTKTPDVLGYVDMERGTAQPTQTGVSIRLRAGSKVANLLFDAWFKGDSSALDAVNFLQKFEFVDGAEEGSCLARIEEDVMIAITDFSGEAGGYLGFTCDFHYSNKRVTGTMPKTDGDPITFTPDAGA